MTEIKFIQLHDWVIVPEKADPINISVTEHSNLRYSQRNRQSGMCYPYKAAHNLGWILKSPFDIEIEPIEKEYQLNCTTNELSELGHMLGIDYWIKRDPIFLGVFPSGWFRIHQALINNHWISLFNPNGDKSLEWRLGIGIDIPSDYMVLFLPLEEQKKIKVHQGILTKKTLDLGIETGLGISLAIEPCYKSLIRKGEPIAKMLIIEKKSINQKVIIERFEE